MIFPIEYPPRGVFVDSLQEFPFWALEGWLYRYTDYPKNVPNRWIEIPGDVPCFFHPRKFAKYLEALSYTGRSSNQSGPRRPHDTGTPATTAATFPNVYAI